MASPANLRGKFITLEGGEGAGKSTQARHLKQALEARGLAVVLTREPGGTPGAEEIRNLLVHGEPERWTALSETLLFLAARADHVARLIRPALDAGKWVICDRFTDSTIVYQGIVRGVGVDLVRKLQNETLGGFGPDVTLLLDIDPAVGMVRTRARDEHASRFEKFDADFHRRLRVAFCELAAADTARCVTIDAAQPQEAVLESIARAVQERLFA
jgi:dTMP kinase